MARWRRRVAEEEAKYSPSQPRVPAGNARGGQWTDRGGGQGTVANPGQDTGQGTAASFAQPMGNVGIGDVSGSSELGDLFKITPDDTRTEGIQVAAGRPVDLLEEEGRDGHAVEEHVRKSDQWLLNDVRSQAASAIRKGDYFDDFRSGSFTSLEAANKLVNATIAANQGKVDRVVIDRAPRAELDYDFDSPTGREAYMRNERSQAVLRDTYSVRVVIVPDNSEKGYRVLTAFPRNR